MIVFLLDFDFVFFASVVETSCVSDASACGECAVESLPIPVSFDYQTTLFFTLFSFKLRKVFCLFRGLVYILSVRVDFLPLSLYMKRKRPSSAGYRNPGRYRLDFIKENTFNRIWSVRMTRAKVVMASAATVAAVAALIVVLIVFTPLRQLVPGTLKGDLRARYLEDALRLDSLESVVAANDAYINNIMAVLSPHDSAAVASVSVPSSQPLASGDTLIHASEAERAFVRRYEDEERFNLSVLAPIAAEGMLFNAPVGGTAYEAESSQSGARFRSGKLTAATAVYRGTVVGVCFSDGGVGRSVVVQHPNDFVTVYSGLDDVFVDRGDKVVAGQRIGHAAGGRAFLFELWHGGTALDPAEYIAF